jgi:6-phosphogluconolactonase
VTRPLFAYVGSYTTPERHGQGNGINVYRVDRRSGAFMHVQHLGGLENPSFLALDGAGTHLYSVHGDRTEANSFTIDRRTGHIAPLNRQSTGGYNPVHLAFDATGRFLAVCNYGTDSLAVLPVAADGSLLPYRTLTTVTGTLGPHRIQQRTMCVHHIPLDRQGRFFYVPCKGSDVVIAYRLDPRRRVLVEANRVAARPGAAPRHIDFHPKKALAYITNELDHHQRARLDPHHLPAGPSQRRAHAAADHPVDAGGLHRLQHRRRDRGRSRRPQPLRLQPRP